jgi:hypothetical protein
MSSLSLQGAVVEKNEVAELEKDAEGKSSFLTTSQSSQ